VDDDQPVAGRSARERDEVSPSGGAPPSIDRVLAGQAPSHAVQDQRKAMLRRKRAQLKTTAPRKSRLAGCLSLLLLALSATVALAALPRAAGISSAPSSWHVENLLVWGKASFRSAQPLPIHGAR
jgi:hypothetical protein